MIVAHVSGIPVEESLLQLAPAAAAMAAAIAIAGRTMFARLRRWRTHQGARGGKS